MTTRSNLPRTFKVLAAAWCLLQALLPGLSAGSAGDGSWAGTASGGARALYLVRDAGAGAAFKDYKLNGYSQRAYKTGPDWTLDVESAPGPLRIRKNWALTKEMAKALKKADPSRSEALLENLAGAKFRDDAVMAVFKTVREGWSYVEKKEDASASIEQLAASGEASCLSISRLCVHYLSALGIPSEIVIGIRFPAGRDRFVLKGGALHSWLAVEADDGVRVFCDPLSTFGFVPHNYIYFKDFKEFDKGSLQALQGAEVVLTANRDRIFYNPVSPIKPSFWRRAEAERSTGGILIGKVMGEKDVPASGTVVLRAGESETAAPLWEGNFYFFIDSAASYTLELARPSGKRYKLGELELSPTAMRTVALYAPGEASQ